MTEFGEFKDENEVLLASADVSARASDGELQVVIADEYPHILAALTFQLCDLADRLDPYMARIIEGQGYPITNRGHVLEAVRRGRDMHLRPFDRRFIVTDRVTTWRVGMDHLFGRPIEERDVRRGISMQLANESLDALTGYGGTEATDEEKRVIRGYTKGLLQAAVSSTDLSSESALFLEAMQPDTPTLT